MEGHSKHLYLWLSYRPMNKFVSSCYWTPRALIMITWVDILWNQMRRQRYVEYGERGLPSFSPVRVCVCVTGSGYWCQEDRSATTEVLVCLLRAILHTSSSEAAVDQSWRSRWMLSCCSWRRCDRKWLTSARWKSRLPSTRYSAAKYAPSAPFY